MSAFDVGVLCSLYEAAPLAALEMMAMGLPVVVSNVGGAAEMVLPGGDRLSIPSRGYDVLAKLSPDIERAA
jgi:glycosyltransferase involved in cell wall biosynthesis